MTLCFWDGGTSNRQYGADYNVSYGGVSGKHDGETNTIQLVQDNTVNFAGRENLTLTRLRAIDQWECQMVIATPPNDTFGNDERIEVEQR